MTGAEIEAIILASAKANVRVLDINGLRLEFGEVKPASITQTPLPAHEPTPPAVAALTAKQHEKNTEDGIAQEEYRVKRDRAAMLLIENPLEYERLMLAGELLDEEEGDGDDEALDF